MFNFLISLMATPAFADRPVKFKAFTIGEVVKLKKKGVEGKADREFRDFGGAG